MNMTDAERTIVYLSNELRKAIDTAMQQHQILTAQRDQLKKADAEIVELKQLLAKQPA